MIRVFLVDDHDMVRFGFRSFLSSQTDIDVVGDAASAEEALMQLKRQPVDVLVCDLHLPGMSGLEVTERLVRSESPTRVIVVSAQLDGPLPKRVMDAGAAGYLSKHCGPDELVRAVRDVSRGKRYLAAEIAQQWALNGGGGGSPFDELTAREMEVALMLMKGERSVDIAKRLSLSEKTVSTHKTRLLEKLNVKDVVGIAHLARLHGVIDANGAS